MSLLNNAFNEVQRLNGTAKDGKTIAEALGRTDPIEKRWLEDAASRGDSKT
jgi:hypothetical protein